MKMKRVTKSELIIYDSGCIMGADNLFERIKRINIDYSQENFLVFYMNTKHKILHTEILFKGGLNSSIVDLRTLFRNTLLQNAHKIVVAHNHPSGNLTPSEEDLDVYKNMKEAGKIIQIEVLDFVIFNRTEFFSCGREYE